MNCVKKDLRRAAQRRNAALRREPFPPLWSTKHAVLHYLPSLTAGADCARTAYWQGRARARQRNDREEANAALQHRASVRPVRMYM